MIHCLGCPGWYTTARADGAGGAIPVQAECPGLPDQAEKISALERKLEETQHGREAAEQEIDRLIAARQRDYDAQADLVVERDQAVLWRDAREAERNAHLAEITRLKSEAIHKATPFTAAACLKLEEILEEKDKEIARLTALMPCGVHLRWTNETPEGECACCLTLAEQERMDAALVALATEQERLTT
jgi:hypothetical protein